MGKYQTALERQIRESILIETFVCDNVLNGKGEWGANLVPRAMFGDCETQNQNQNPGPGPGQNQTRLNRNRKPDDLNPNQNEPETPNNQNQNQILSDFDSQIKQRRKKRRMLKELNSVPDSDLPNQNPERRKPETRIHSQPESMARPETRKNQNVSHVEGQMVHGKKVQTALHIVKGRLCYSMNNAPLGGAEKWKR